MKRSKPGLLRDYRASLVRSPETPEQVLERLKLAARRRAKVKA